MQEVSYSNSWENIWKEYDEGRLTLLFYIVMGISCLDITYQNESLWWGRAVSHLSIPLVPFTIQWV